MKKILVLTDFSESAKNAAEAAIIMASNINADIILLNTYAVSGYAPSNEPMPWPLEYFKVLEQESADELKNEKNRLEILIRKQENNGINIAIDTLSLGGELADNLITVVRDNNIEFIMMGGRKTQGVDLLFGTDINTVIAKATLPVFIISSTPLNFPIKNVVFATDLNRQDVNGLNYILGLSEYFGFKIHLCHVKRGDSEEHKMGYFNSLYDFEQEIDENKLSNLTFVELTAENIKDELQEYSNQIGSSILILNDRKHSFFGRLLHETPASDLIKIHKNPMLIIPAVY